MNATQNVIYTGRSALKKHIASVLKNGRIIAKDTDVVLSEDRFEQYWSGSFWLHQDITETIYQIVMDDGRSGNFKVIKVEAGEPNLVQFLGIGPLEIKK